MIKISDIEPKREIESVKADTGLGHEWEENCRRYPNDKHKIVCLKSTKHSISHIMKGLNPEARRETFKALHDIDNALEEIKKDTEDPERISTPPIKEATVIKKENLSDELK